MHDDRQLIEERLKRALRERLRPAIYGAAVPLDIEVWHAPGEPVSPVEALAQTYEPARPRERAPAIRGRACAHRLRLALAAA